MKEWILKLCSFGKLVLFGPKKDRKQKGHPIREAPSREACSVKGFCEKHQEERLRKVSSPAYVPKTRMASREARTRLLKSERDFRELEKLPPEPERRERDTSLAGAKFANSREILRVFREIVDKAQEFHEQGLAVLNFSPSDIKYRPEISLDTRYLTPFGHPPKHTIDTGFSAPEVATGVEIDKTADIYALGCLLFWMLTGRSYEAFKEQDIENVPPVFQRILNGCLAVDRDDRFQTIEDLIFNLDHIEKELAPVISTRVVVLTTIGNNLGREANEDSLCYVEETSFLDSGQEFRGLYAVIDGMGGLIQGRQASQIASLSFKRQFKESEAFPDPRVFIVNANREILEKLSDGGAAASLVLVHNRLLKLAHLGDTRAYLFREGKIYKLTLDHSLPYLLYFNGMIEKEDLRGHRDRNQLTNYLGMPNLRGETIFSLSRLRDEDKEALGIQEDGLALKDGDILLLCSDGLWDWWEDHLTPEEETHYLTSVIFGEDSLENKARRLLENALQNDGSDNVSLLLVQFSILDRASLSLA